MKTQDPKRSEVGRGSAGPADSLANLFEHAQSDGFTPAETQQLWTNLGAVLGLPASTGGSTAAAGSASTVGGALGAKTLAVLLFGAGAVVVAGGFVAVGTIGRTSHGTSQEARTIVAANAAPPAAANGIAGGITARDIESPSTVAPTPSDVAAVRGSQTASVPPVATAAIPVERISQPKVWRAEATAHPASPLHAVEPVAAQPPLQKSVERAEEKESPVAQAARPAPTPTPNEGALLLRARQVLASDPSAALELTRQHAKLFPVGGLVPEREVLAIEALVQLGRLDEAQSRFATLRARFPQSPHLARVEGLLRP